MLLVQTHRAHWFGVIEMDLNFFQQSHQCGGVFVAGARFFGFAMNRFFNGSQISQCEFGLNYGNIIHRAYLACHVDDIRVFETAHDIDDCIGFANVREELITQTFPLGSACHQSRDIDEFHRRCQYAFRFDDLG